ncbi:MAG: hypothetical protein R3F20_16955 [Planctomycetota bacterium]
MTLAERDDVIGALATDAADDALDEGLLPERLLGADNLFRAHRADGAFEDAAEDGVAIAKKVLRLVAARECLADLVARPLGGRLRRHLDMNDPTTVVGQDDEDVEHPEGPG